MSITKKIASAFAGVVVALVALGMMASSAAAITQAELMAAGFTAEQAAIVMALVGGNSSSSSSSCVTYGLPGATGIQQAVNALGYSPALTVDGKIGPMTRAGVMWAQGMVGAYADGAWGPKTQAAYEAYVAANCSMDSGSDNGGDNGSSSSDLSGGAGSVTATLLSSYSGENVGEGDSDVKVLGVEYEADANSDIALTAVKVTFDHSAGTEVSGSSDRLNRYLESVDIMLNGDVVGSADVSDFSRTSSGIYTKTIALSDAIIDADEKDNVYVSVNARDNIDTGDEGEVWSAAISSMRYKDATGAILTDTTASLTQNFTATSLSNANDVEAKFKKESDSPENQLVKVSTTSNTNDVELLHFTIKAQGSDLWIDTLPVFFTSTGTASIADQAGNVTLVVEGTDNDGDFSESTSSLTANTGTVTFDNLDMNLDEGDTAEFWVTADVNDIEASTFDEGDTLKAEIRAAETASATIEDESGNALAAADRTGTALGKAQVWRSKGINVSLVGSPSTAVTVGNSSTDDLATFTIKYRVTAFGTTAYVPSVASVAGSASIVYAVDRAGTAETSGVSGTVVDDSDSDESTLGNFTVYDGESEDFTLSVLLDNSTANTAGQYRAALSNVYWATTDTTTYTAYTFDLDEFKTDYVPVN